MRQVGRNLFAETGFDWANVGAAVTEAGVVLIDSPVRPTDSRRWQGEVGKLSPNGIRWLIATDYHGDHTTGAAFIPGVIFVAPLFVHDEISKGTNAFSKEIFTRTLRDLGFADEADEIDRTPVPLPQICFESGMTLHLPPLTFEIRLLGGHSPACSCVYVPEEGVVFSSDVVINGPSAGMRDANLARWIQGLEYIEKLPAEIIVPGHGEVCGKEVVRMLKNRFSEIRGMMGEQVRAGKEKAEAVADPAFQKFFHVDASRGEYWVQQRKDTFREGLERVYDEVRAERGE